MTAGFVYLIQAENGLTKIGRSTNPAKRLQQLASSAVIVTLLHQIQTDSMVWLEGYLHGRYAALREKAEWFRLSSEELSFLGSVQQWNRPQTISTGNVKERRKAAGMSQQELAAAANLSISIISSIEQGRIEDPRASTLRALARALGVKMDDLLAD